MRIIPKFQNSGKIPTKEQVEYNKKRQQFLNMNGYNIKVDGSWGPWQQQQYDKLTTVDNHYHTTPLGVLSYFYDKYIGDGTTHHEEPYAVTGGTLKKDTRSKARAWVDKQMKDDTSLLGYTAQTVAPVVGTTAAITYGGPYIAGMGRLLVSRPAAFFRNLAVEAPRAYIGDVAVNGISKAATGKTWAENVAQSTGASTGLSELTNPGLGIGKPLDMMERRAIETVMRTTSAPNPIPEVINSIEFDYGQGFLGNKLSRVVPYVLTGYKRGPKGSYNSFAQPSPDYMYTGIEDRTKVDGNDYIDAFLYKKKIDPSYEIEEVAPNYGIHKKYIKDNYPDKDVKVYKRKLDNEITDEKDIVPVKWMDEKKTGSPFKTPTNRINVGGHLVQRGYYTGVSPKQDAWRAQDLWHFHPVDYYEKWLSKHELPLYQKVLAKIGLNELDRLGTPIITKTDWVSID